MEINYNDRACLLLIAAGRYNEAPSIFTNDVKDRLLLEDLITVKHEGGWKLTNKGWLTVNSNILIKYPMHVDGNVGSYNQVIKTMSDNSINAFMAAAMNNRMFDRIDKRTARVFGQHLLDIGFYKKFGSVLINKWYRKLTESLKFFKKMDNAHKTKTKSDN